MKLIPKTVQHWAGLLLLFINNPRAYWSGFQYKKPILAAFVLAVLGYILVSVLSIFLFLQTIRWGAYGPLPDPQELHNIHHDQASEVYAADSTLLGRYYLENRSFIGYDQLSPHLVHALVATEDARFFRHRGIDWQAWARVFFKSILFKRRSEGGGSTISQQLAKNLYPRQDYGRYSLVINKIKEVMIACNLEREYTKKELLELYLNTVPFSENTYGIKVAAHRFFNTSPAGLRPEQAAVLVAMLKATAQYDPTAYPERSLQRRNLVLQRMAVQKYISKSQLDSLQALPLGLDYRPMTTNEGLATYFREHLRQELKDLLEPMRKPNGMRYNIYTDGLKVYTTLDATLQTYAEEALRTQMESLQKVFIDHLGGVTPWENDTVLLINIHQSPLYQQLAKSCLSEEAIDSILRIPHEATVYQSPGKDKQLQMSPLDSIRHYLSFLNAGLLSIDPMTGAVKAWVGGIDHKYFKYDHVKSHRQVGSTFKPIVYAKALQQGYSPCTYTANYLKTYWQYEGWQPKNADNRYGGLYSMEGGLIHSVNTIAVRTMMRVGPKNVAELAENLGFEQGVPAVPAIALGAVEASLLEMVSAYSTFANGGKRPELTFIDRIVTKEGRLLYDSSAERDSSNWERVLTQQEATIMNEMLQQAVNRGTGVRLRYRYKFTNELAGKTGTSQNHSDGWFMGYNPKLVTGVWVGAESPGVRFRSLKLGQGANTALPIFAEYLQRINADPGFQHISGAKFPEPDNDIKELLNCPNIKQLEEEPKEGEGSDDKIKVIVAAADADL